MSRLETSLFPRLTGQDLSRCQSINTAIICPPCIRAVWGPDSALTSRSEFNALSWELWILTVEKQKRGKIEGRGGGNLPSSVSCFICTPTLGEKALCLSVFLPAGSHTRAQPGCPKTCRNPPASPSHIPSG